MIYLDNNATTMMPPAVKRELIRWCNRGNPSAGYESARAAREMMTNFRRAIGGIAGISVCCKEGRDGPDPTIGSPYKVIFTSGGSEANATVTQYFCTRGGRNHVIASAVEHKSLLDHLTAARDRGQILLTIVAPRPTGEVHPDDIAAQIRPDTTLICVMHANNETGRVNDVVKIGQIAAKIDAHFHCDTVQSFGKIPFNGSCANSFSISFHKLHGPAGCGALVVRAPLWPLIYGSQNEGLRGGTENLPGIGASALALRMTSEGRMGKNRRLRVLKQYIIGVLSKMIRVVNYTEYIGGESPPDCIVLFSDSSSEYLPGTLLLSVVSRRVSICNGEIKREMERRGVIISIGSACNTASASASHVLVAMAADEYIRRGALRISLGDDTSYEDAKKFVRIFAEVVAGKLN